MPDSHPYSTPDVARMLNVKEGTIRTRLHRSGSLYGVVPVKLATGRLAWPSNAPELLAPKPIERKAAKK